MTKYKVTITQIHPNNWSGKKYCVRIDSLNITKYSYGSGYEEKYARTEWGARRIAKRELKERTQQPQPFQPKVIEEYGINE